MAVQGQDQLSNPKLRDWLSRMNWASDAERNLFLLACILCLLLPPLGIASLGLPLSLLLLASHLVLLLYCATMVQRRYAIVSNIIVMLSLVNFLLANFSGLQRPDVLIYIFCLLAAVSLPFSLPAYLRAQRQAREALQFKEQDDYRWLLTRAPLMPRWRFTELLREHGILA